MISSKDSNNNLSYCSMVSGILKCHGINLGKENHLQLNINKNSINYRTLRRAYWVCEDGIWINIKKRSIPEPNPVPEGAEEDYERAEHAEGADDHDFHFHEREEGVEDHDFHFDNSRDNVNEIEIEKKRWEELFDYMNNMKLQLDSVRNEVGQVCSEVGEVRSEVGESRKEIRQMQTQVSELRCNFDEFRRRDDHFKEQNQEDHMKMVGRLMNMEGDLWVNSNFITCI